MMPQDREEQGSRHPQGTPSRGYSRRRQRPPGLDCKTRPPPAQAPAASSRQTDALSRRFSRAGYGQRPSTGEETSFAVGGGGSGRAPPIETSTQRGATGRRAGGPGVKDDSRPTSENDAAHDRVLSRPRSRGDGVRCHRRPATGVHRGGAEPSVPRASAGTNTPRQPPGFVLHAEAVLQWLGVHDVSPEVLRRAKRGLREEDVASKMWRALLRVCLLHRDATLRPAAPEDALGPEAEAARDPGPDKRSVPDDAGREPQRRVSPARQSFGEQRGREEEINPEKRIDLATLPLGVVIETCAILLRLWGYGRSTVIQDSCTGDRLNTREILLALAWVLTICKAFQKYEEAHYVSPVPTEAGNRSAEGSSRGMNSCGVDRDDKRAAAGRDAHADSSAAARATLPRAGQACVYPWSPQGPPRFPRDVSELPEAVGRAREAYMSCLSNLESVAGYGGAKNSTGDEQMERALGAGRELMCAFGRLEGELRVLEGLEVARGKLLSKMRALHEKEQHSRDGDARDKATSVRDSREPRRETPESDKFASAAAPSQKAKRTDSFNPYVMCLLTKSDEEVAEALASISRACLALEAAREGRAHKERWYRWITSAVAEANNAVPQTEGSGTAPAGDVEAGLGVKMGGMSIAGSTAGQDVRVGTGLRTDGVDAADDTTSERALQEHLERQLRAVAPPPRLSGRLLSAITEEMERSSRGGRGSDSFSAERAFGRASPSAQGPQDPGELRRALRKVAERVDNRLGHHSLIRALEHYHQDHHQRQEHTEDAQARGVSDKAHGRDDAGFDRRHGTSSGPPQGTSSAQPAFRPASLDSTGPHALGAAPTDRVRLESREAIGGGNSTSPEARRWTRLGDLEDTRQANREMLRELLRACEAVVPYEIRGEGWRSRPS